LQNVLKRHDSYRKTKYLPAWRLFCLSTIFFPEKSAWSCSGLGQPGLVAGHFILSLQFEVAGIMTFV
jgi:hypothetical protein